MAWAKGLNLNAAPDESRAKERAIVDAEPPGPTALSLSLVNAISSLVHSHASQFDRYAGKVGFSPDLESTRMWGAGKTTHLGICDI